MGGCLFQGRGRCGVWMVNDLCLFSWFSTCAIPTFPELFFFLFTPYFSCKGIISVGVCMVYVNKNSRQYVT